MKRKLTLIQEESQRPLYVEHRPATCDMCRERKELCFKEPNGDMDICDDCVTQLADFIIILDAKKNKQEKKVKN